MCKFKIMVSGDMWHPYEINKGGLAKQLCDSVGLHITVIPLGEA